jgi:hypothetical protein
MITILIYKKLIKVCITTSSYNLFIFSILSLYGSVKLRTKFIYYYFKKYNIYQLYYDYANGAM